MKYIKTYEKSIQIVQNDRLLKYSKNKASLAEVKKFVELGADVNCVDHDMNTPLHLAAKFGAFSTIKFLIKNGANVNAKNKNGMTPLMYIAAYGGYSFYKSERIKNTIKYLIENGADITLKSDFTNNPDIFDFSPKFREFIMENFPEEYERYIINKTSSKYNI